MYAVYRTFDIYILIKVDRCVICVCYIYSEIWFRGVNKKNMETKKYILEKKIKSSRQAIHIYVDE